jgi:hypothetical protein
LAFQRFRLNQIPALFAPLSRCYSGLYSRPRDAKFAESRGVVSA